MTIVKNVQEPLTVGNLLNMILKLLQNWLKTNLWFLKALIVSVKDTKEPFSAIVYITDEIKTNF